MLHKTITSLFSNTGNQESEVKPTDVIDAFRKVDRILDTAFLPSHVDTAERMFVNMLSRYGFKSEDRVSLLIVGMQERINVRRAEVDAQWNAMNRVAA